MTPDQEHQARLLAHLIVSGDTFDGAGRAPADVGAGEVTIEMRGMVRTIRRHLLLDHAAIGKMIGDEVARQASEVNLRTIVAAAVKKEIAQIPALIEREVADRVRSIVRTYVDDAVVERAKSAARR